MPEIICFKQHNAFSVIEVPNGELSLPIIKQHIGNSDGKSYMECIYNLFPSMPQIILVCSEDGKLRGLRVTIVLPTDDIAGDCFLCASRSNDEGEFSLYGLTKSEVEQLINSRLLVYLT